MRWLLVRVKILMPRILESKSCSQETKDRDYRPRVNLFLKWVDEQGLTYWKDLRLQHLQTFARGLVDSGKSSRTIQLQSRVVKMASKWAALNWPEEFRDFAAGFKAPQQDRIIRYEDRGAKPFLRIAEVAEFVLWLRCQPNGFNILSGIALQGLCSLRVREVLRLTWDRWNSRKGR